MKAKIIAIAVLLVTSVSLFGDSVFKKKARVLLVDVDKNECPNAGFTKIQTAVDAAVSGDIIQVCPGTYDEQVQIAKPLSLVGIKRNGKNAAVLRPSNITINADFLGTPTASIILVRDTADVSIKNITVDGINNGLVCDSTFPTMDGIFFRNASGQTRGNQEYTECASMRVRRCPRCP
jgi:hypothetical protein